MSSIYQSFAYLYDKFMDNIPYHEWSQYILDFFQNHLITDGTLIELGCGTGTLCQLMADAGYSVIGIDNSTDMLTIAADKLSSQKNVTLLCQNMTDLDLGDTVYDGFYCVCDSLNYLLTPTEVLSAFSGVQQYLKKNGIFIFDLKTHYFYETVLGNQVFCDHQKDCSYIWENSYFDDDCINQYDLTVFTKVADSELFQRFCETHHQRAYTLDEMIDLLSQANLKYVAAYDAFTDDAPTDTSERIYIIAKK